MASRAEGITFLPPARDGNRMFSSTFKVPTRLNIWKMNPTRSRRYTVREASDMEPRSIPSTVTVPESKWLKDATLRLAVYNIFDKKYVQSTRHAVQCTVGEPRTFEVGLKTTF